MSASEQLMISIGEPHTSSDGLKGTEHKMQEPETLETVSLIRGGAFYRFQEVAHLIRPNQWNAGRRIFITVLVGWVPLVALTALSGSAASLVALLKDYRVFARVFIAVPLLIAGQKLIEERFRLIVRHFFDAGLLRPEDSPRFREILATTRKLKDAWLPELALVALGCVGGIVFVGNDLMFDAPWSVHTLGNSVSQSLAGWYFELVTQTIYMVLLGLALWKWFLYVLFFWRVSRLQLQLIPCDPDQSGGLGFLGYSPTAFIPVVIAASTAMGSVLRSQAPGSVFSRASLTTVVLLWIVVVLLIFVGPLAVFGPKLTHLYRVGYLQYGSLAHLHAEQFHEKWVHGRQEHLGELLAAQEINALNNLASSFDRLRRINLLPVDRTTLIEVTAAAAVPMLPVIITQVPLTELLKMIFRALF
jgi:hypothetical protein